MAKAKAQSAATWSGTKLVCAAVQQETTLNYVVMTMRLLHGGIYEPNIRCQAGAVGAYNHLCTGEEVECRPPLL